MVQHKRWGLAVGWLPYILATSDCIAGLGSGMTIKYFPIWLYDTVGLAPSAVQYVQAAVPFVVAASALLTQRLAGVIGEGLALPAQHAHGAHTHRSGRVTSATPAFCQAVQPMVWPGQRACMRDCAYATVLLS